MEQTQLILIAFGILLLVSALIAGVKLDSSKRIPKALLLTVGVVGVGGILLLAANAIFAERHQVVAVSGVGESETFSFALEHERLYFDGVSYHFTSGSSWPEIVESLELQFPDGESTSDTTWELRSVSIPVKVSVSSVDGHEYVATRQVATIGAVDG